jgi:hypothetical protein
MSTPWFQVTGMVTHTQIVRTAQASPLLRHTDLDDVRIFDAQKIEVPAWAEVLVEADGGPLLLAGEIEGRRIAVLAFDLQHSDLPLQVAFPILLSNLVDWLAPAAIVHSPGGEAARHLTPGTPVLLYPPIGEGTMPVPLQVVGPDGKVWTIDGQSPAPFAETHSLGIYRVEKLPASAGGGEDEAGLKSDGAILLERFTVSFSTERESQIAPKDSIALSSSATSLPAHTMPGGGTRQRAWWRWAALAGIAVLLVEWSVDRISRISSRASGSRLISRLE